METTETIAIVVNGEPQSAVNGATVSQLLETLGLHAGRVAIERNLEILPRSEWARTQVARGDRYEIVQFVGGG
jgi:sulfur carrier protein